MTFAEDIAKDIEKMPQEKIINTRLSTTSTLMTATDTEGSQLNKIKLIRKINKVMDSRDLYKWEKHAKIDRIIEENI